MLSDTIIKDIASAWYNYLDSNLSLDIVAQGDKRPDGRFVEVHINGPDLKASQKDRWTIWYEVNLLVKWLFDPKDDIYENDLFLGELLILCSQDLTVGSVCSTLVTKRPLLRITRFGQPGPDQNILYSLLEARHRMEL